MNREHLFAMVIWLVVTGIVNFAMRKKTPEEWEVLAEKNPRYAAFARMLRAIGLDPVKLIVAFVDFVRGHAKNAGADAGSNSETTTKNDSSSKSEEEKKP